MRQGHVFANWHALTGEQRDELLAQLRSINPAHVNQVPLPTTFLRPPGAL